MTREEAIALLIQYTDNECYTEKCQEAHRMAISALCPVSREQMEKVFPGCEECHNQDNWLSWIGKGFVYCPKCGTPLASWAWEKQMQRLEELKDATD